MAKATATTRARHWCVTSFQDDPPKFDEKTCRYMIFQAEICPETKAPHWQIYWETASKGGVGFRAVQKSIGDMKAHCEPRRGTAEQAIEYCRKPETRVEGTEPFEFGSREQGGQGHRSDLDACCEIIKAGGDMKAIAEAAPGTFVRYHKGLDALRMVLMPERDWQTTCEWVVGPPGVGKTRYAMDLMKNAMGENGGKIFITSEGQQPFTGYDGEPWVILEELSDSVKISRGEFCRLIDRIPYRVDRKLTGKCNWLARHVIVTSNLTPAEFFKNDKNMAAVMRRIEVRNMAATACAQEAEDKPLITLEDLYDN